MKRMMPMAVALLGGFTLFALAPAAQAASGTLFPDLRGEDFPRQPNEVRVDWLEAARGSLVGHGFHTRPGDVVFPSLVTAAVSVDPKTGAEILRVTRLDDDCIAFAARIGASPEEGCLAVTAVSIDRGVERLTLQARFFDYQVSFYLVQSRDDASEWNLAPTGRKGEPQVLRLRTRDAGDSLVADWELSYRGERHAVSLPLHVTLPAEAIRVAGLTTVHAALASAPELLYDMGDFLVWEVMREDGLIDMAPPTLGDEDDDHCQVLTDCPAEYQSCSPTPGGWLACDGMADDGGWGGGGVACHIGGCQPNPTPKDPDADWQFGSASTTPAADEPLFGGMREIGGGYRLIYDFTSVLQKHESSSRSDYGLDFVAHIVDFTLRRDGSAAFGGCNELRLENEARSFLVFQGDTRKYTGEGGHSVCPLPQPGLYELRYEIDPHNKWGEGDGEGNNIGRMRGKLLIR